MAQLEVESSKRWADSTAAHSEERQSRRNLQSEPVMRQLNLFVGGMSCRRCVREVSTRLRDVPGVETVSANPGDCVLRGVIC
jgi:Heavy-metal-associated domain